MPALPKRVENLEERTEIVWAAVMIGSLRVLVRSAYRSPTHKKAEENNAYDGCLLMDDFNLDVDWLANPPVIGAKPTEEFSEAFAKITFAQLIKTPTRLTDRGAKIIDLMLCDTPSLVTEAEVVPGVSDHDTLLATLSVSTSRPICAPRESPNLI